MPRYLILLFVAIALAGCGPSLAERKDESKVHYELGVVHLGDNNLTEALKELTRAVETYPEDPSYHNALGLAYFYKGMNDKAVESIKRAVKLDPDFSEARNNLAAVYIDEGRWDDAISQSEAALENIFYSTPELALYNMGVAWYNKGNYEKAAESLRKAGSEQPAYAKAFRFLGMTYDRMGKYGEAAEAYRRAVRVQPGYVDAHFRLGLTLVKLDDKKGALEAFSRVVEIAPESEMARSAREYIDLIR